MTVVNSMSVAKTNTMHAIIHWSNRVVYEMGGVMDVKDPNIADRVSMVVILMATRPESFKKILSR